jgi:hypothetical protein
MPEEVGFRNADDSTRKLAVGQDCETYEETKKGKAIFCEWWCLAEEAG